MRENETQLEYSSLYDFQSVARFGNIEILELQAKQKGPSVFRTVSSDDDSLEVFRAALRILRRGEPAVAESLLVGVERRLGRWGSIVFHRAVAKSLAGHAEEAMELFRRFRTMPQAGSFIQQAWYHQEILDRYRQAQEAEYPDERAQKFHVVAVNYWELGYRAQSFRMLDSALAAQPTFFPALIFGAVSRQTPGDFLNAPFWISSLAPVCITAALFVGRSGDGPRAGRDRRRGGGGELRRRAGDSRTPRRRSHHGRIHQQPVNTAEQG